MNSTTRFSNRVEDYVKYRPAYPVEVITYLQDTCNIAPGNVIADIGAGTGISAKLFLEQGYTVIAVEPNKEMREKAIELLHEFDRFSATDGTAENTLLADKSMDMLIAAQAFHWFNKTTIKPEWKRILKPGGYVALIWNERLTASPFEKDYDEFIKRHAIDYVQVDHRNIDLQSIREFFAPNECTLKIFSNYQDFDFTGLKGRLLSSSYMPQVNDAGYPAMIADLQALFDRYAVNNTIRIMYDTKLYTGQLP